MFFDALWSYRSYPDLLFANFYRRPSENLKLWDEQLQRKGERLVAIAGNDSHANVGISLNDTTGKTLLGAKRIQNEVFDSCACTFWFRRWLVSTQECDSDFR